MMTWCMEHPWMTFFIIIVLIECITAMVKYITHYYENDKIEIKNDKDDVIK